MVRLEDTNINSKFRLMEVYYSALSLNATLIFLVVR